MCQSYLYILVEICYNFGMRAEEIREQAEKSLFGMAQEWISDLEELRIADCGLEETSSIPKSSTRNPKFFVMVFEVPVALNPAKRGRDFEV